MALGQKNFVDFVDRFQKLRQQRDTADALVRDLMLYCDQVEGALKLQNEKLQDELQASQLDLADAAKLARDLQRQLQVYEAHTGWLVTENEQLKERNSYVLVMIDGDGMIFREYWLKQGFEGGKKAAQVLKAAIDEQCGDRAGSIEIVCKVIANAGRLSKSLALDGSLDSLATIRDFATGFAHACPSFDFVDVGSAENATALKLKDNTQWHLRNHNCKHILLGISHDASYAPFLDEILKDDSLRQCVSVIEGVPIADELAATGVNISGIGKDLFRDEKLAEPSAAPSFPAWRANAGPRTASPAISVASSNPAGGGSLSYASVTSSGSPPPQVSIAAAIKPFCTVTRPKVQYQQVPPQQLDWNPGPRGLDEPITVSVNALENIKKRKDIEKLCNNHFLRRSCLKGDMCMFDHRYKPTADEINAVAVLARHNPCTNGQDCDIEDCIYGHHCPSIRDGVCGHPFCKFPEHGHPPGTKFKNSNVKSNI